jgi:hypothetical protein
MDKRKIWYMLQIGTVIYLKTLIVCASSHWYFGLKFLQIFICLNTVEYRNILNYEVIQCCLLRSYAKEFTVTYKGYAWLIITCSGLDDWIYWYFYYSFNYSQLQRLTIGVCLKLPPFLPALRVSPTVTDFHESSMSYESLLQMNYVSFYTLVLTGNRTFPWTFRLLYCAYLLSWERVLIPGQPTRCVGNVLSEALPSNALFRLSSFLTHSFSLKRA